MKISFGYFRLVIVLIVILLVVVLQNVVAPLEKTDGWSQKNIFNDHLFDTANFQSLFSTENT